MTCEKLSENLNLLMAEARLNASELARRTGIPPSSIKKIRNNDNPNPTLTTLTPLANFFSISVSQLIGDIPLNLKQEQAIETSYAQRIPVISWDEAAAWPKIFDKEHAFVISEHQYSKNVYGLVIEKDINERFLKSTLLLVECEKPVEGYDYAIVLKDKKQKPSIKQVLIEDDQVFLKSLLIDSHIIPMDNEHKILGVVVEYRSYLK